MSKTAFLEPMEDLAYRRMLDHCYLTELPLPESLDEIAMLIRMRTHCDSIKVVLHYFFELTPDGYINDRVSREIDAYHGKSAKAKASANARWSKKKNKINDLTDVNSQCDIDANALRSECEGNANHKPLTINHKPLTINNNISENSDKPKRFNFKSELLKFGCDENLVDGFMAVRKTKKATNSEKAFELFLKKVNESGLALNKVLEICIEKDWKGFDVTWMKNQNPVFAQQQQPENTFDRLGVLADEWDRNNATYEPY